MTLSILIKRPAQFKKTAKPHILPRNSWLWPYSTFSINIATIIKAKYRNIITVYYLQLLMLVGAKGIEPLTLGLKGPCSAS